MVDVKTIKADESALIGIALIGKTIGTTIDLPAAGFSYRAVVCQVDPSRPWALDDQQRQKRLPK